MEINLESIARKVTSFSKSSDGQGKIRKAIKDMRDNNQSTTAGGSKNLTIREMAELADALVSYIKNMAASSISAVSNPTPQTVIDNINSLTYSFSEMPDGSVSFDLFFSDNLHRDSLYSKKYKEGIDNIIALFNNGYVASNIVYGYKNIGDIGSDGKKTRVSSLIGRETLGFMQSAIDAFVGAYGSSYNFQVILNTDVYDGNYTGSLNGVITGL